MAKTNFIIWFLFILTFHHSSYISANEVNWRQINPNLEGAVSVGNSKECVLCHGDYIKAFQRTKHAKVYKAKYGMNGATSCEVCHGPLSQHLEEPDLDKKITKVVSFKNISSAQRGIHSKQKGSINFPNRFLLESSICWKILRAMNLQPTESPRLPVRLTMSCC